MYQSLPMCRRLRGAHGQQQRCRAITCMMTSVRTWAPDRDERPPGDAVQVLQDSLCGSSKVMLVCNLSPEAASATETLSSLNFASRAAQVRTPLSILQQSIPSSECFCGPVCILYVQGVSAGCPRHIQEYC